MVKIYICDDEPDIRKGIEEIIRGQILIHGYDMGIAVSTEDPEELLRHAQSGGGVYFLDVELKGCGMDGFELGKRLRALDAGAVIIYITAFGDLAFRTFQYHIEALDYIVKGDAGRLRASVCGCLAEIVRRLERLKSSRGERAYYTIRFMDSVRQIPVDEIYYFETSPRAHRVILYAKEESVEFPGKLSDIADVLGEKFFRSHRAYLINLDQVQEFLMKENTLVMKNGGRCLAARNTKLRLLRMLTG